MNTPDFSYWINYEQNSLTMILSSILIGIVIASAAMLYRQLFLGGIVRRIIERSALSPESAMTLQELGYNPKNLFIKFALRKGSTFRKTVLEAAEGSGRYYIPEEKRIREEIRFRKKGNSVFGILIGLILFSVAGFALLTIIPWLTDSLTNIFS